jgi:hypothetical protein
LHLVGEGFVCVSFDVGSCWGHACVLSLENLSRKVLLTRWQMLEQMLEQTLGQTLGQMFGMTCWMMKHCKKKNHSWKYYFLTLSSHALNACALTLAEKQVYLAANGASQNDTSQSFQTCSCNAKLRVSHKFASASV